MAFEIPNHVASSFFMSNIELADQKGDVFNGRCPVCGDSSSNTRKRRLYMLRSERMGWGFYCHNGDCEVRCSFARFAKEYFPYQWDSIKTDIFESMKTLYSTPKKTTTKKERKENIYEKSDDTKLDKFINECCISFGGECKQPHLMSTIARQRKYLLERLIPEKVVDTFYYCWSCSDNKKEWGGYINRIIIPFFNKMDNMYYFQGRATTPFQSPKYLNWDNKDGNNDKRKPVYNEFFIDKDRPVIICEGILDSVFVKNGCSTLGVKFSMSFLRGINKRFGDTIWVMDNDKDGILKSKLLFEKGERCFLMPTKYNAKDLNELAIILNKQDLTDIILKNTHSGFAGLVKVGVTQDKLRYGRGAL